MESDSDIKVGDLVMGTENFAHPNGAIKPGVLYEVREVRRGKDSYDIFVADWWWGFNSDQFIKHQPKVKPQGPMTATEVRTSLKSCKFKPVCGSTKVTIKEPEEQKPVKPKREVPALPAGAFRTWPGIHDKMSVAKYLNELKDD